MNKTYITVLLFVFSPVSVVAPLNAGATGDVDHEENAEPPGI